MKIRLYIAFTLVVASCVLGYPYARDALMGFDRSMQRTFDLLPMGISVEDATSRLGSEPICDADEWCLPQRQAFEAEFDRAEKSDAVRFCLFRNGINWYYCLGFDVDGKLVVSGQGCS